MAANYSQLLKFQEKLEKLNDRQKDEFFESCCKELAARLLAKVIKRTPSDTGTLRRGWTGGESQNAKAYADSISIRHVGSKYQVDITNPIEYASYVEYGHRTPNHAGWVEGRFMLTISETELNNSSDKILQAKLNKYMKEVFGS